MKLTIKLHKHSVLVLAIAAVFTIIAVFRLQGLPLMQFVSLSTLVFFYLIWALIFHHFDKSLKLEVMIEYILTALLALVILYGVLL